MAEEVGALRISLGLDTIDFTRGMKNVNTRLTALNAEFKAITAGSGKFDNSLEGLRSRADVLTRTFQTHQRKVAELKRRYEESKEVKGEDADETVRLAAAYNRAVSAMKTTENRLNSVNQKIEQQSDHFSSLQTSVNASVESIGRQMRVLESRFNATNAGLQGFGTETDKLRTKADHLSETLELQRRRVDELSRLHREAVREKGADAQATQDLEMRLNAATAAMRTTSNQLNETNARIEEQSSAFFQASQSINKSVEKIGQRIQLLNSNFSTVTAGIRGFGSEVSQLQQKATHLSQALQLQQQQVSELSELYNIAATETGADSDATRELQLRLNQATAAMRETESQLRQTNNQIEQQSDGFNMLRVEVNEAVNSIERQMDVLQSSFNATTAGIREFGNSTDQLEQRANHLNQTIQLQRRRVEELTRLHREAAGAVGEDAQETQELQIRLNRATQEMREAENQLQDTTNEINQQRSAWRRLRSQLADTGERFDQVGGRMQSVGSEISQSFGAATLAIGAGLGISAKKAMDFESQMSSVKSVMSPDEVNQFGDALEGLAMKMGAETKYSAMEAAQGIEELIKAGVSVTDIVNGGLEGALSLAVAGELELADAAEVASTALNAFKDDNLSVMRAADLLAGAANASATSVGEMKYGLSMVSAVASGIGLTFEDTTSALAAFAQNGLKGSDAGTSLKTMLLNLSPSSEAASSEMEKLGLLTKEGTSIFYDASGSVKSLSEIAGILKKNLSDLSDEQRQMALKTIFGTDAIRAANILYKEGAEGIDKMTVAMNKIKSADVAATKLDNVKGRLELLKGSAETAAISFGNALLPTIDKVIASVQKATDWFNDLSPAMKENIATGLAVTAAITGVITVLGIGLTIVGGAVTGFGALATAAAGLGTALTLATGPVGLIAGGIAALTVAGIAFVKHKKKEADTVREATNVNLEHAQSLLEQKNEIQDLSSQYESLREKNRLSNDELLLFRDLQDDLKTAKTDYDIQLINNTLDSLQERSGLSNKELQKMLSLNDELADKLPTLGQAFSDQGNSIISNTEDLRGANKELQENLKMELELQRVKAEAKLDDNIEKRTEALKALNETLNELNEARVSKAEKEIELQEALKQYDQAKLAGDETGVMMARNKVDLLQNEVDGQSNYVSKIADEVANKREALEKTDQQIEKTQALYDSMINLQLASAGITAEGDKGISQLDSAISKTETRIGQLNSLNQQQGGLNEKQQEEYNKLTENLGMYRNTKGAIQEIQAEQGTVNSKIEDGKQKAGEMSDILSESEVKDIAFSGDGIPEAKKISNELEKKANKYVKADDKGSIDEINRKAKEPVTKNVHVTFSQSDISVSLKNKINPRVQGAYAVGTKNAPPGLAWVGEEGPELIRLQGGEKIIPSVESEEVMENWKTNNRVSMGILKKWNIPMFSDGTTNAPQGFSLVGEEGRELVSVSNSNESSTNNGNQQAIIDLLTEQVSQGKQQIDMLVKLVAKNTFIEPNALMNFVNKNQASQVAILGAMKG